MLMVLLAGVTILYLAIQPPKLSVPKKIDLTLSNVTIWNPGTEPSPQQAMTISKGIITHIKASNTAAEPTFCDGCYALPGLIDAHIHTPPSIAIGNRALFSLLYLQSGVTSVRDLGQFDDDLPKLINDIKSGQIAGPRMYHCGRILDGNPSVQGAVVLQTTEDGKRAVINHARDNVDCIKVYGNIPVDAFKGVAEQAKLLKLPLVGHTPNAISFHDLKNFESQHYTGIPYLDTAAPKNRAYRSQDLIDMTDGDMNAVIGVMVANNISFLPTNANLMSRLTVSDPVRFPPSDGFKNLPEFWDIAWQTIASHPETNAEIKTELDARSHAYSFIKKAHESGIDVLVGTDVIMPYVIPGEAMHQQLSILSLALGSEEEALQAATQTNGQHIDPGKIGKISIGAYADILLFKSDPRGDLSKIKNWDYAVVDGRLYTREDVDSAVKRIGRHVRSPAYATVMGAAYDFVAGEYDDTAVNEH